MVRDGIVFKDEDGQVIFNQYSFCELVKHLLVELVGISYEEASQIVDRSPLAEPVADAMGVAMFSHDLPYYWATIAFVPRLNSRLRNRKLMNAIKHLARYWANWSVGWCSGSSTQKTVLRRTPPSTALSPDLNWRGNSPWN